MDRLNWSKLKTFYRVASSGSFARAAEKYNITSSALSKMIKSLEYELNCQLFVRTEIGVELTTKGQLLYKDAIRITKMPKFTEEKILDEPKKIKNHLKLVAPTGLSTMYISQFIDSFINKHSDIYLKIISFDEMSLNEKLSGHILINTYVDDLNGYKQEPLMDTELKLYASSNYLKKYGIPIELSDLDQHRLISFSQNKKLVIDLNWHLKIGREGKKDRLPILEADGNFGRCFLAHKDVGIITVPQQHPGVKTYNLVQILPEIKGPQYTYYLIVDNIIIQNENVNMLWRFLKEKFSSL